MTSECERIAVLEQSKSDMAKDIQEIKSEIREIRGDVSGLKISMARWTTGALVAYTLIQFILDKFIFQ